MDHFILDGQYKKLLDAFSIDVKEVLSRAQLPATTFDEPSVSMRMESYFRLFEVFGAMYPLSLALKMATSVDVTAFSPPLLAAMSAPDGHTFLSRLARYKKLLGPMELRIHIDKATVSVEFETIGYALPPFLLVSEYAFLVHALRQATGVHIVPHAVQIEHTEDTDPLANYLNCPVKNGRSRITFDTASLDLPFQTHHPSMWNYLEPELERRREEVQASSSIGAMVRRVLTDLLPTGDASLDDVALALHISKRSLQRRLQEEGTTFQKELASTREMLAITYIKTTDMTASDIAYLLGYVEINSFLRAFSLWTGHSFSAYRHIVRGGV